MTTNNDRTADIERCFADWQTAKRRLILAQSHLAEAIENGWSQHVPTYRDRVNLYIEQEQQAFQRLLQARG